MKLTTSMIAIGLLITGAAIAAEDTGNAPGGTGIEQSTEGMGATNKQGDTKPMGQATGGATAMNKEDCEKAGSNWDETSAKCLPGAVGGGGGAGAGGAGAGGAGGG
jgi:hypothetical protein